MPGYIFYPLCYGKPPCRTHLTSPGWLQVPPRSFPRAAELTLAPHTPVPTLMGCLPTTVIAGTVQSHSQPQGVPVLLVSGPARHRQTFEDPTEYNMHRNNVLRWDRLEKTYLNASWYKHSFDDAFHGNIGSAEVWQRIRDKTQCLEQGAERLSELHGTFLK